MMNNGFVLKQCRQLSYILRNSIVPYKVEVYIYISIVKKSKIK